MHPVRVLQVGRLGYKQATELQRVLSRQHLDNPGSQGNNTLVLVEHSPVYTVGLRTRDYPDRLEGELKALGAEFHRTNRGGLITFHGPGQLVAYPILNLHHFKPSMRWYIATIERMVIEACGQLGVRAHLSPHTGVWVGDNKICAIGVHGSRFVTTHGLALNCDPDLSWFEHIVPCGIPGKGVTSLSKERDACTSIEDVVPVLLDSFSRHFQCLLCDFPAPQATLLLDSISVTQS